MLRLGISSCLLGERVRYDANHKREPLLVETLAPFIRWLPVCPEIEAGMGAPREPIRIERASELPGERRLRAIESRRDLTESMSTFVTSRAASLPGDLHGFVLKAKSPSCGRGDAAIHDSQGEVLGLGDGFFASALTRSRPDLPLATEAELRDREHRIRFFARAAARLRREEIHASPPGASEREALRKRLLAIALLLGGPARERVEEALAAIDETAHASVDFPPWSARRYGDLLVEIVDAAVLVSLPLEAGASESIAPSVSFLFDEALYAALRA